MCGNRRTTRRTFERKSFRAEQGGSTLSVRCYTTRTSGNVSGTIFIDTNLWMDIYAYIFLKGLKTGYRAQNSNTDVADAVTRSSADSATEYGCDSM